MEITELMALVSKPEWADVELKTSARAFPKDAASSLCAFANCGGGFLILGVDEKKLPAISGIDADKLDDVQNQCLGLLKDIQKFSSPLLYDPPSLIEVNGKYVLVVQIQDSKRQNKPVKMKEKGVWIAYVRNGARDEEANDYELAQMLLDASSISVTDQLLEFDIEQCFNADTINWYRKVFEGRHSQKHYKLSNLEFLDELGLIREDGEELKPTKASILMFGSERSLNHTLSRNVVGAFFHKNNFEDALLGERWEDRRPREHETKNLFDCWRIISEKYMDWANQSFQIDESNLHRNNETPDYIGFREATVNILVHQDFSDHTRVPKIEFYKDISQYWNPGDSLVEQDKIATGQSKSRNPLVMQVFHRIGLSERAGSGIKEIYRSWLHLDRPEPIIENSRKEKTFKITLGKQPVVSPLQKTIRERVGVSLTDLQARVFAAVLNQSQAKTVDFLAEELSVMTADIYPATDYLVRQGLLEASPDGYQAMAHFSEALTDLQQLEGDQVNLQGKVTKQIARIVKSDQATTENTEKVIKLDGNSDQVTQLFSKLTKKHKELIHVFEGKMVLTTLCEAVGVTHRTHFKNKHLQPIVDLGIVTEVYPDNPNHPSQAYCLTELGLALQHAIAESD